MSQFRKLLVAVIAGALTAGIASVAAASSNTVQTGSGNPVVYHTVQPCCRRVVLGPQSHPTYLAATPPLRAGWYLVNYTVGVVIGRNDNVVCAAWIKNDPTGNTNDGVFSGAGNGATESGTGPGGVYGNASTVDTIHVKKGQRISVTCNAGHYGQGTYASGVTLTATKIGTLIKQTS
jgi:hypothetical protein